MRRAAIAAAVGAAALIIGVAVWWTLRPVEGPRHGTLAIVSTPPGASITIGGAVVGTTPWFSDNHYVGEVAFEVTKPGFKPWAGSFPGGKETRVEVALVRRARRVVDAGAGELSIEIDDVTIEDDRPLHPRGPLRPAEPTEFVDEDLDREAESQKKP